MSIRFSYDFFLTDSDNEESIVNIDENGKITKIPYSPFDEAEGEEYYERLIEEQKEREEKELENSKNKFLNFDRHWVEVEKIEEAEYLLIIHKEDINRYDLREIKQNTKEEEIKSMEEMFNMKIYYLKYSKQDLRKRRRKR